MNIINLNKINMSYGKKVIFSDFNMTFNNYKTYSILGPCGCGKTTLLKVIGDLCAYSGDINYGEYYGRINAHNMKKTVIVFDDDNYINYTLKEEINDFLESNGYSPRQIVNQIDFLKNYFDIEDILEKNVKVLSKREKMLSKIILSLIKYPDIIAFDDIFKYLSSNLKKQLIKYFSDNSITFINVISDIEDSMYTDYMYIFMKNGKIAIEGKPLSVFKEEKLIRRLGFNLPFMVDLSIQLSYYGLIDNIYLSKEEMVDKIWK